MPPKVKLINVAIASFLVSASVLSIVALATPEWIIQDLHGRVTFGLSHTCYTPLFADDETVLDCTFSTNSPPAWSVALFVMSIGCICLIISAITSVASFLRPKLLRQSKWMGLAASVNFCIATLIFPAGFDHDEIGGSSYKLPENASIGFSYIVFIVALLFIFFAEILTVKIAFEDH